MTSAPEFANVCVPGGPADIRVESTTRRPSRAVGAPCSLGIRPGSCGLAVMIGTFLPFDRSLAVASQRRYGRVYTGHCHPSKRSRPCGCAVIVFSDRCYEQRSETRLLRQ